MLQTRERHRTHRATRLRALTFSFITNRLSRILCPQTIKGAAVHHDTISISIPIAGTTAICSSLIIALTTGSPETSAGTPVHVNRALGHP